MEKTAVKFFYIFLALFVCAVIYLSAVMLMSPRRDALERGFIPCTRALVTNLSTCRSGGLACSLKYFWADIKCNINVVVDGFSAWSRQEQKYPWSNYLFEPVYELPQSGENYDAMNLQEDWEKIVVKGEKITKKIEELENAKIKALHLNQGVNLNKPEEKLQGDEKLLPYKIHEIKDAETGDISTEAFSEDIAIYDTKEGNYEEQEKTHNLLKDIKSETQNKLNSGELNNEK